MKVIITYIFVFIFSLSFVKAQKFAGDDFLYEWQPNPTEFLRKNNPKYFTKDQYCEIVCAGTLTFEAVVEISKAEVISVKYSKFNTLVAGSTKSTELRDSLQNTLAQVIKQNVGISSVKYLGSQSLDERYTFLLTIIFDEKDRKMACR